MPEGVRFHHGGDENYMATRAAPDRERFNLVVVNYAINHAKAEGFARELLLPGGRLLAPSNVMENYWFEQAYELMDEKGKTLWSGRGKLGAYDVLFQPDFTSPTCTGNWCPSERADDAAKQLRL